MVLKNWYVLPSGSGRPLHWKLIISKFFALPLAISVEASTSWIFIVMPASASWAWMTSASWMLIGRLFVVTVNVKPAGWPPSSSLAFAFARSRLMCGIARSYAQLAGEIGPFAG